MGLLKPAQIDEFTGYRYYTSINYPDSIALSRVEAAGKHDSLGSVNLSDPLYVLSEPYASQADQAGLALSLDLPQDPIEMRGDPAQLRRAIGNLLDNAIKFTPEGGTVTIGLQKAEGAIELGVQGTGIGIPEENVPHFSASSLIRRAFLLPLDSLTA